MAFSPFIIRDSVGVARTRRESQRGGPRRYVRHSALGAHAIYAIVEESRELVTAEVFEAPGLAPGTRVRMLASAARAMDEIEPASVAKLDRARRLLQAAADGPPRAA